jgi:hypothetical protein
VQVPLEVYRALDGVQRVRELEEEAVANRLDLPPPVDLKETLNKAFLLLEKAQGGGLILLGKGRVAHDIREDDGSEPTFGGHG